MKKLRITVLVIVIALILSPFSFAFADNGDTIVYVTNTGTKYHELGCSYLKSCNETTLLEAVSSGYSACSRCHPPMYDGSRPLPTQKPASSGGGSYSSHNYSNDVRSSSYARNAKEKEPEENKIPLHPFIILAFGLYAAVTIHRDRVNEKRQREEELRREQEEKARFERMRQTYINLYGGKPPEQCCAIPLGSYIGDDGLPCSGGEGRWGSLYTFYKSPHGAKYHRVRNCSEAVYEVNAARLWRLEPCKRCKPNEPDTSWFIKYSKIKRLKEKYNVP